MENNSSIWRRPTDRREAVEAIDRAGSVLSFVEDALSQSCGKATFSFSQEGQNGLYFILRLAEETMRDSARLLMEA